MLDFIRRNASSMFIKIILGLIAFVFVLWGVGNYKSSRKEIAATVNGEEILFSDYQSAYNNTLKRYQQVFKGNIPPDILQKLDIRRQALDNLVDLVLVRQEAKKWGILVSNQEIQREIMNIPDFKLNNQFNKDIYLKILTTNNINPAEFEEEVRTQILMGKIRVILGAGIIIPDIEIVDNFNYNNEEINLSYIELGSNNIKNNVNATEEQIVQFYEANKEKYKTNPMIKIKYINFPQSEYLKEINISEKDLVNYYEENLSKYQVNEQRKTKHILLRVDQNATEEIVKKNYDKAIDLLNRVKAGESFEEIAKEFSDDKVSALRGGELGLIERGQLVKPFEDMLFSMKEGNVSEPVLSAFGWHLIKLEGITPERHKKFDEVKSEVNATLTGNRLDFLMQDKINSAYDEIVLSGSLDEYSDKKNIKIMETDYFDDPNKTTLKLTKDAVNSLFQLNKGSLSPILKTSDGAAIAELVDIKPPYIPELQDIKENVQKELISVIKKELLKTKASEILSLAKKSDLSNAINKSGLKNVIVKETGFIKRKDVGTLSGISSEVIMNGFKLTKENPYPEDVFESGNKFYLISLKDKNTHTKDITAAEKNDIKEKFYQTRSSEVFVKWVESLRKGSKIKITEGIL